MHNLGRSSNINSKPYQGAATLSVAVMKESALKDLGCAKFLQLLSDNPYPRLPSELKDDTVFDPFYFESTEYYHYYRVSDASWNTSLTVPLERRATWGSYEDKHTEGSADDNKILRAISFLPSPAAPPEADAAPIIGPFIFRDRRFCWIFEQDQLAWGLCVELEDEGAPVSE